MAEIYLLDIETAPKLAYVWRFFKENISPKQVLEHCRIISFSAKKLHSKTVIYEECRGENDKKLIKSLVDILDRADIVIAHNGRAFDMGTIKGRAIAHGIKPPSPYKVVDTLISARKELNIESNSLEYLAEYFNCKRKKLPHSKYPGFLLWKECLAGNPLAWKELKTYNIEDTLVLEEIYLKMRPYISNHPNVSIFSEGKELSCTKCDSTNIHMRGNYFTSVSKYHRYVCKDCGSWSRTRYDLYDKKDRKVLGTGAQ